jgi:hypothetical protein
VLAYSATSLTFVDVTLITWSFYSVAYAEFMTMTRSVSVVHTFMQTIVAVPVYVRTVVPVRLGIVMSPTTEPPGINTGTLLGIVGGSGAAVAVLIGIVLFIVRHQADTDGEKSASTDPDEEIGTMFATNASATATATVTVAALDSAGESLSSCSDIDQEAGGLFV